jgi:hypothetical protein
MIERGYTEAPDPNPLVPCQDCGREERWEDIQESGDWQVSKDPDVPFLCPGCKDE